MTHKERWPSDNGAPALPDWMNLKPSDWREHPDPQRVERVWLRLEDSLLSARGRQRWVTPLWAAAAAVVVFGLGFWAGRTQGEAPLASVHVLSKEPAGGHAVGPASAGRARSVAVPTTSAVHEPVHPLDADSRHRRRVPTQLRGPAAPSVQGQRSAGLGAAPEPAPTADDSTSSTPAPNVVEVPGIPKWQRLANRGEYEAALYELGQAGGFEHAVVASTPEQLLLLGDIARATGQRQRAAAALRRIVNEFPNDPAAPLAAWSLGSMLERDGDSAGALEAFSAYRALSPGGDFAEDALVRELEAALEQGNRAQVLRLAKQYESQFPDGRRSEEVALWAAQFEAEVAGDAGAPAPSGSVSSSGGAASSGG